MSIPQLRPDLLAEPAARAARLVARERVRAVDDAYERFCAHKKDALHDLRVALRRLRSWIRAYQPVLDDTLRRRTRRGLADLARATNLARDGEVWLEWTEAQRGLSPHGRAAKAHMAKRLSATCDQTARAAGVQLAKRLPRTARGIDAQLSYYWLRVSVDRRDPEPTMAHVASQLVRRHTDELVKAVRRVRSSADVVRIHRARIAGKHLRYLIEPLAADARTAHAIDRLRALQDRLGVFHDARLLADWVRAEMDRVARRPVLQRGLAELLERARADQHASYLWFRQSWNVRGRRGVLKSIRGIASELRTAPGATR